MPKKVLKIIGIIAATIAIIAILFFIWTYIRMRRGDLVKWDNHWYTKEQLKAKYPPQYIEVPAKNTPEEVYAKFRQSLLDNDIEAALEQMREKNRNDYREAFKDKEKFDKWVESLPEELNKEREEGNYAYYNVNYGTENKNTATFIKNEYGYWEIDQI